MYSDGKNRLIDIQGVLINFDIISAKFCCDLEKCKGACCFLNGGKGAPLAQDEIETIKSIYQIIKDELSEKSIDVVQTRGIFEGSPGEYNINCIDDRDCIFVYYENKIAKCAIERAYINGRIKWRKPLSCHLYPIRINHFGGDVLRYSRISECMPAIKNGSNKMINLIDFLKEPLIRKYGLKWFEEIKNYSD
jgi:hypothetical protein